MASFSQLLLNWHKKHGRKNLPWQKPRTAYRVWLSEIMLQQTQVVTVIPYFQRFIASFPDVNALANAKVDEVLKYWAGLGYYARARNLHRTAQIIQQQYHGKFPADLESLQDLPGIGRSTAGAILALSMNKPAAILDGNVKRVLTRLHAIHGWPNKPDINKQLWKIAEEHTPTKNTAAYTQAIMDLGATICTPKKPQCLQCPVKTLCKAYFANNPEQYPTPKKAKTLPIRQTYLLILHNNKDEILLEKRPPTGIWGGLWSLPESRSISVKKMVKQQFHCTIGKVAPLPSFRHTFSHFHLDIQPLQIQVKDWQPPMMETPAQVWYNISLLEDLGLPAPVRKLLCSLLPERFLRGEKGWG
jgi:A/G-specific adenine glycosylase